MATTTVDTDTPEFNDESKEPEAPVTRDTEDPTPNPDPDEDEDEGDGDGEDGDDEEFDAAKAKAKIHKVNREAEGLRRRLKAAEEKAKQWDEYEESQKGETEKVADRIRKAEERAASLEKDYNLLVIKTEFGLTDGQVKRLTGSTLEELREDAEDFVSEAGIKNDGGSKKRTPKASDVNGGLEPRAPQTETDPAKLAGMVRRR